MSLASLFILPWILSAIDKPFIPGWSAVDGMGLRPFAAEVWLIATIVAVLLTPFFVRRSNLPCALVTLIGLAGAFVSTWIINAGQNVVGVHFHGMLVMDQMAVLWKLMLLLFVIGIVLMWFVTTMPRLRDGDGPEFFTLLVGATLGMSLMASTSNLLMLFMAVEMASLPSYVLAGFRKTHRVGAEASLKYVLFGAASSSVMVYGLSLLYGLYGTLQIEELGRAMIQANASPLLAVGVFGIIVGIGFKISAVPFHFWCPDVFEGASIDVAAFLSVASKGAGLILLMRVIALLSASVGHHNVPGISLSAIAIVIGILGALTATVGNLAAFVQNNIKRLLAYSSIAQAGYMLCALALLTKNDASATQAILIYLAVYLFMNLGAFTVAGVIEAHTGSDDINSYAGMSRRSPVMAICMAIFMVSLIGLPPLAGFAAKLNIMFILGDGGGWWWTLLVIIGINTILSLYYYLRVVKVMFFNASDKPAFPANLIGSTVAVTCAVMLVVMLICYQPLYRITGNYGKIYLGAAQPRADTMAQASNNSTSPLHGL